MDDNEICGVVLAGGAGIRMHGHKPNRIMAGRSLLAHVLARLAPQCGTLILNGDPAVLGKYTLPVISDATAELAGPLAGILAALRFAKAAGFHMVISAPCDTPFLPLDLVQRLYAALPEGGVSVARSVGALHPTIALWPVTLIDPLAVLHEQGGERRVRGFIEQQNRAEVDWPSLLYDPFFNVNTPLDLAIATAIAETGTRPEVLDLCGLKCPLPALKAARALESLRSGTALVVLCTDPMAEIDLPNMVAQAGHCLLAKTISGETLQFTIRRQ